VWIFWISFVPERKTFTLSQKGDAGSDKRVAGLVHSAPLASPLIASYRLAKIQNAN
jgi:hypothetical protein